MPKYMGYVGHVARIDNASGLLNTKEAAEEWLTNMLANQHNNNKKGFVVEVLDIYQATVKLENVTEAHFNPLGDL